MAYSQTQDFTSLGRVSAKLMATALTASALLFAAAPAEAGERWHGRNDHWDRGYDRHHHHHDRSRVSFNYVSPGYYYRPAPVYYRPAPVYYRPAPVYYRPAPAYYYPAPVYSAPYSSVSFSWR